MRDNKEVRRYDLVVQVMAHHFADLMRSIRLRHLISKAVDLLWCHWLHKVNEEIVIETIYGVLCNSLE